MPTKLDKKHKTLYLMMSKTALSPMPTILGRLRLLARSVSDSSVSVSPSCHAVEAAACGAEFFDTDYYKGAEFFDTDKCRGRNF